MHTSITEEIWLVEYLLTLKYVFSTFSTTRKTKLICIVMSNCSVMYTHTHTVSVFCHLLFAYDICFN